MNKILLPMFFMVMLISANAGSSLAIAQPNDEGWVRKAFDFGSEDINFETIVPPNAKVETTELGSPDPGTIGKVKIVGKIHPASGYSPVDVTIKAFDFAVPAAASQQLPNVKPPVMLASAEEPALTKAEVAARSFRFSATSTSEEDMGETLATLIWHDGRLYAFREAQSHR